MTTSAITFKKVPTLQELKAAYPDIRGLFFDMDGTLFNTEVFHAGALEMIGKKFNIRPPHSPEVIHTMMVGKADHFIFEIVRSWEGFPQDWTVQDFVRAKNKNLIDILSKENPEAYVAPEVRELISSAQKDGLYLALVTSSEKVITEELLKIANLKSYFKIILTRDDCLHHKPDPWPYLKALELSSLDKSEVIIFEDSPVGLQSALAAGAHAIKCEWYLG